jgi:hypothetical protein
MLIYAGQPVHPESVQQTEPGARTPGQTAESNFGNNSKSGKRAKHVQTVRCLSQAHVVLSSSTPTSRSEPCKPAMTHPFVPKPSCCRLSVSSVAQVVLGQIGTRRALHLWGPHVNPAACAELLCLALRQNSPWPKHSAAVPRPSDLRLPSQLESCQWTRIWTSESLCRGQWDRGMSSRNRDTEPDCIPVTRLGAGEGG